MSGDRAEALGEEPLHGCTTSILDVVASRGGRAPNIDFAFAVLTEAAGMEAEAGEAIFAVARSAGWIAHAIEEYDHPLRYRPRARYTGPVGLPRGLTARVQGADGSGAGG